MIRVCIYHYEMGAFRRAWIQTVTQVELIHIQKSEFRRVLILDEDDWYGASAPSIL
jgi:hypothetical protein